MCLCVCVAVAGVSVCKCPPSLTLPSYVRLCVCLCMCVYVYSVCLCSAVFPAPLCNKKLGLNKNGWPGLRLNVWRLSGWPGLRLNVWRLRGWPALRLSSSRRNDFLHNKRQWRQRMPCRRICGGCGLAGTAPSRVFVMYQYNR